MTTTYLAGPMRGYPRFNHDRFDSAAATLREEGRTVLSPADHDHDMGFNPDTDTPDEQFMRTAARWNISSLLAADEVCVLPGWEKSTGARLEVNVARWLGIPVYDYVSRAPISHGGHPEFLRALGELEELHRSKAVGYGTNDDPLANCRASEAFGVPAWVGTMVRANDKMHRIQRAAGGVTLTHEGVDDSLIDLAAYALIGLVLHREVTA